MSETDHHSTPEESHEPFSGDRGWKGLARSDGEVATFAMVAALLLVIALAGLVMGLSGILLIYVALTFITLGVLVVISYGG